MLVKSNYLQVVKSMGQIDILINIFQQFVELPTSLTCISFKLLRQYFNIFFLQTGAKPKFVLLCAWCFTENGWPCPRKFTEKSMRKRCLEEYCFYKCETMPWKDKTIFLSFGNLCLKENSHFPRCEFTCPF